MATLYDISKQWLVFLEAYAAGEIPEEAVNDTLESIEGEFEAKAENIAKIIANSKGDILGIEAEIERLQKMKESIENQNNRLKNYLYTAMKETGKIKFKTGLFSFSICKNGGLQPLEITGDVPTEYCDLVPNSTRIRRALIEGENIDFAILKDRGEHLRIG